MTQLLQAGDPSPSLILNPEGTCPILLACEHAGQGIPKALGDLGLSREQLDMHIGWDIGAAALTHLLSERLNATAILQHYSRLVIDCNRPPEAPDSVPEVSDKVTIPANVDADNKPARVDEIFTPYQGQVSRLLDSGRYKAALSIHSFTPVMQGVPRPWDIGFLFGTHEDTSRRLAAFLEKAYPWMTIGFNEPYQVSGLSDWFVPRHGEARGLPHALIEVRNDHISDKDGQEKWADILAASFRHFLEEVPA
nr:N-formylglutamate amidohydrolase [uncultured Cohaesibacter sp.]